MSAPCPVCDVEKYGLDPVSSLALGVALGAAFRDMHAVTVKCCPAHRTRYVTAMLSASMISNTVEGGSGGGSLLDESDREDVEADR